MINTLDATSELFLTQVNRMQKQLAEANRQVSSGKQIGVPSDAPDEIGVLLQLRATQVRNEQVRSNLTLAKTEADTADDAVASAIQLMDRALVLANQGATGTIDATNRKSLSEEVESLLNQMVSYSRTTVQGRYIFSGDQDRTPAYSVNLANVAGVQQLNFASATVQVEDAAGGSFAAAKTAREIFDLRDANGNVTTGNVFYALNRLRAALAADSDSGIENSLGLVKEASYHLNSMQSFYGSVQRRVEAATNFAERYATQLKTEISSKEDADMTAAALQLSQTSVQMQAAMQFRAKLPKSTLFDYIG
jgi:flagellar hook-associated protein 3 FlgL